MGLAERIREVMTFAPEAGAIEFERRWITWRDHEAALDAFERLFDEAGLAPGAGVAVLVRNRPAQAAAMLATVASRRRLVSINPHQSAAALAADIETLRAPALVLDRDEWEQPGIAAAARRAARLAIVVAKDAPPEAAHRAEGTRDDAMPDMPGVAIQMLTSGTTGKPKRIDLAYGDLEAGIFNVLNENWSRSPGAQNKANTTPGMIYNPFAHVSGLWNLFFLTCDARPFVLFERFKVDEWASAVKRHGIKNTSLVPSAVRMVMDANVPREDLATLMALGSGTAPLPKDLWEAFEAKYGIALLPTYGSTEFAGAVARWTYADHKKWIAKKLGAAGRAIPGNTLRIVDPQTGAAVPVGSEGLVEVSSTQLRGGEWVRTTDLGVIDEDGFLWIRGRADGAINRGGFKILPDEIEVVLRRHPDVHDAAVVGLPDARLGQVPAAAVEPKPGHRKPTPAELEAFAREHLVTYKVPAKIKVLDTLPRSPSMKPILPAVRELLSKE
jgi:acyl-coenzyme A synthetase/AMP-(fatty) acid ligase